MMNVINAKANVTAMLPVTLTPRGVNPNKFKNHTKKNTVSKYGIYFLYFFTPILGIAISSLIYKIIGSKNLPTPVTIGPLLKDFAIATNAKNINIPVIMIISTLLVIEKSNGFT